MARTIARRRVRRRRTPPRGPGGRFLSRRHRSNPGRATRRRRSRRHNPSGYVRTGRGRRRRWHKITEYAKRRRRGRRRGQIRGYRFPRSYRRRRRRVLSNPPVRRHRRRRSGGHRRRYVRRNPAVAYRLAADPIGAIKEALREAFSMDTLEALFHTGLGFGGVAAIGRLAYKKVIPALGDSPIGRVGTMVGTTVLGTALIGMVTKNRAFTARFLAGGLLATLWQGLSEALPDSAKEFIPTLGDGPETEEFRRAIEKEVLRELRGGVQEYLPAAGSEGVSEYIQPAGIQETYLTPAGSSAFLTENEGAGVSGYLTQNEVDRTTGIGDNEPFDEFSRKAVTERF